MRLALIPPLSMLDEVPTSKGSYHLYLPMFLQTEAYLGHIWSATRAEDSYTILDNGAFEDSLVAEQTLLNVANAYGIHEVVIPDALGDTDTTIRRLDAYWRITRDTRDILSMTSGVPKHMAVVQGKTLDECMRCIDLITCRTIPDTFGLPKQLVETVGRDTRLSLASYITENFGTKYPIHLLGQSPLWPREVELAKGFQAVRGMDTSMPFVYAYYGLPITAEGPIRRPVDYFNLDRTQFHSIYKENIATLQEWMSE